MSGETSARLKPGVTERCPWCHQAGCARALAARCDACGAGLHPRCAEEAEGCPTLGCAGELHGPPLRRRRWRSRPLAALLGGASVGGVLLVLGAGALRLGQVASAEVVEPPRILSGEFAADAGATLPRGTDLRDLPPGALAGSRLRPVRRAEEDGLEGWRRDQLWRAGQWLAASQAPDGSWSADGRSPVGTTSLALAALEASGSTGAHGAHRRRADRALAWLLEQQQRDGGFGVDFSEDTALATLALALVVEGRAPAGARRALERALFRLEHPGAYRSPTPYDPMARRLARAALSVPSEFRCWGESPAPPDLGLLVDEPERWVEASWSTRAGTEGRAVWRASLVVYLRARQHPSGAWTSSGALDGVDLSWVTARNALALALLAD